MTAEDINKIVFPTTLHAATHPREFITLISKVAHQAAKDAGWWTDLKTGASTIGKRSVPTMIALAHSELSEAVEGARKNRKDDHLPQYDQVAVELADTIIRLGDTIGQYGEELVQNMLEEHFIEETADISMFSWHGEPLEDGSLPPDIYGADNAQPTAIDKIALVHGTLSAALNQYLEFNWALTYLNSLKEPDERQHFADNYIPKLQRSFLSELGGAICGCVMIAH
jgi:NTP pyrophosphatase (non-canonical NTP hydrolase)